MTNEAINLIKNEILAIHPDVQPLTLFTKVDVIGLTSGANYFPSSGYKSVKFLEAQHVFRFESMTTAYSSKVEYVDATDVNVIIVSSGRNPNVVTPFQV